MKATLLSNSSCRIFVVLSLIRIVFRMNDRASVTASVSLQKTRQVENFDWLVGTGYSSAQVSGPNILAQNKPKLNAFQFLGSRGVHLIHIDEKVITYFLKTQKKKKRITNGFKHRINKSKPSLCLRFLAMKKLLRSRVQLQPWLNT